MAIIDRRLSTGLPGLDRTIAGLIPGDNIVWQVEGWRDYATLARPYVQHARESGRRVVYFRFATHPPLIAEDPKIQRVELDPTRGLEEFVTGIHETIEEAGRGAYYLFDCLSELASAWYSDQMLGNFFMLTCPYLYDYETIAYFGLLFENHSSFATDPIETTTQLWLNVYNHDDCLYVHPIKVQQRHSPTMYMVHAWRGDRFEPVTDSHLNAEILSERGWSSMHTTGRQLGLWSSAFQRAEEILSHGSPAQKEEIKEELLWMTISRDERVLELVREYFSLERVLTIGKRMIGTGLIGGKSVGMLLARSILRRQDPERWARLLEPHDSFFIGSDVFYTFLVENGCWWDHQRVRKARGHDFRDAVRARQRILRGQFPPHTRRRLEDMLDYFGQSPIIIRSSSLLEDNFGNAFAGKYESVFCPNQGSRQRCLEDLLAAIRMIFASTLSEKALEYRSKRGILDRDEQMALLVQRVSGKLHGDYFFPVVAGVGFSFNPYVWHESIDPEAGMLRLVFGLGTRAVDRSDDDYTRIVSLSDPGRRPEADMSAARQYAQRKVDVLDLGANQQLPKDFEEVCRAAPDIPLERIATRDTRLEREARQQGRRDIFSWAPSFDGLLQQGSFVRDMRDMLECLEQAYAYPVDVEFTANFADDEGHRLNLVQCRPLQLRGAGTVAPPPPDIDPARLVLEAHGAVIGQSRLQCLDRLVFVIPRVYAHMPLAERHRVARCIGRIMRNEGDAEQPGTLLIGPGRWGTQSPDLGVPVSFSEISRAAAVCELVQMREDLVPDVSLGTHFFSDLVEMEILYTAMFPGREKNRLNEQWLEAAPNRLAEILPEDAELAGAVHVIDLPEDGQNPRLVMHADTVEQTVLVYLEPEAGGEA